MTKVEKQLHWVTTEDNMRIVFDQYKAGYSKVVVIAHGYFNSKGSVLLQELGRLLNAEYDVIIMDFRGHGSSKGLFYWTTKEYLDLTAVLQFAKKEYERIGVIGFSLGAATSIITATKTDLIDSLIPVSGPTDFDKIDFRFWEIDVENDILYNFGDGKIGKGVRPGPFWLEKQKPINVVEKLKAPTFYIHGSVDWLIKPWHAKELYKKTKVKKRLEIIEKGPHAEYLIRKNKKETVGLIKEWFAETL